VLVVAVLLLLTVGYVGAAWAMSGRVPAGVSIAGVPIGGKTRAAATDLVVEQLTDRKTAPVPVTVGSAQAELDPVAAGLSVDLAGTVDDLVGFSLDPRQMWRHLGGSSEVSPKGDVDETKLSAALAGLAKQVDAAPVEGAVRFEDGKPVPTPAEQGRALDREEAAGTLADDWFAGPRPLPLPAEVTEPAVDQAAVDAAMAEFAQPATAGPLVVLAAGREVSLEPALVTPALTMEPADGRLRPRVDGEVLRDAVLKADPEVVTPAKDAAIRLEGGRPVVVPAQDGTTIDPAALAEAAVAALPTPDRRATVQLTPAEPELTTAAANELGVREVVSSFATNLTADAGRTENIRIAARTVNGSLLLPGETFSLNDTLGPRTPAKGYNEAGVIMNGRMSRGFGGGVSQMATTLFNGMFFAGLEDVEHKPHSFYISRYPEGREATVDYPTVDLKFRNNSPHGVLIETWVSGGQVHTRFWSTKVWDDVRAAKSERRNYRQPKVIHDTSPRCTPQSPSRGWDVSVTRSFVKAGAVVKTERFVAHYIAQDHVICGPKEPPPTPTPSPTTPPPSASPSPPPATG
jgi:vancomycin resistance protein YoaR